MKLKWYHKNRYVKLRYAIKHPIKEYRQHIYWPAKNMWQLARRGWANTDTWSLDSVLCERLGAQLKHLADVDHGWPSQLYGEASEWEAALRANGDKLLNYVKRPGCDELLHVWHELKFGDTEDDLDAHLTKLNSKDTPEQAEAWKKLHDLEDHLYAEAQAAMHWVADHLGHLWD